MSQEPYNILFVVDVIHDFDVLVTLFDQSLEMSIAHTQVDTHEGLQHALKNQNWDLVVCDDALANFTVTEVIDLTQHLQPRTAIILLSDQADMNQAVDMMRLGVRAFIDKEEHSRLLAIVREELTASHSPQSSQQIHSHIKQVEARYQDIVDYQNDLICRYDENFCVTFANKAYCEWQELSADEIIGFNFVHRIPAEQREQAIANVRALTRDNPISTTIHQTIMEDNRRRWIEWIDVAIFDEDGAIAEYQCVGRDVTDREIIIRELHRVTLDLHEERENLQNILNSIQDAIVSISLPDRQFVLASPSFSDIYGYDINRFISNPDAFRDLIHPEDLQQFDDAIAIALQDGFSECEHRIMHPSGDTRWVHRRSWVNYDQDNRPIRLNDTTRDITDRRLAQEALRQSEEIHRLTLSNISDAVFITDDAGNFTFVCPNAEILHGYTQQEILAFGHISKLLGEPVFDRSELEKTGEIANIESLIQDKTGQPHHVLINVKLISIGTGTILYTLHDITERKQAEQSLKDSESSLAEAQKIAHVGNWDRNLLTNELYWSDEIYRIFGLEPQQVVVSRDMFFDAVHPDDIEAVKEAVRRVRNQEGGYSIDHRIILPSGEIRFVHEEGELVLDDEGTPVRLIGTVQDITERKRVEQQLIEANERYRSLVESSDSGIIMVNDAGEILYGNNVYANRCGLTPETIVGKRVADLHTKDSDRRLGVIRQVIDSGKGMVYEIEQNDIGEDRWYRASLQPVKNSAGKVTAALINSVDITDRKRVELALQESEQRFRMVSELMSDSAMQFRVDEKGQVTKLWQFGNHSHAIVDYISENFKSLNGIFKAIHPDDRALQTSLIQKTLEGHATSNEFRMKAADGNYLWYLVRRKPIWNDDHTHVTGYIMALKDITTEKEAELALKQNEQRFRMVSELMSDSAMEFELDETGSPREIWKIGTDLDTLLGYDTTTLNTYGRRLNYIHPDDQDSVDASIRQTLAGHNSTSEYRIQASDGRYHWFLSNRSPVWNDERTKVTGYMLALKDITTQKQANEALQASETRFKLFMEHLPATVFIQSADSRLIYCNEFYSKSVSQSAADIIGQVASDYLDEQYQVSIQEENRHIIKTQQVLQLDFVDWLNSRRHWHLIKFPIPLPDGTVYIGGIATDITEEERAKAELQQAHDSLEERVNQRTAELENTKNRIEAIFNSSSDGILLFDTEQGILEANYTCDWMLGKTIEAYRYQPLTSIFAPDYHDKINTMIDAVIHNNIPHEAEVQLIRDDTTLDAEVSISPVKRLDDAMMQLVCTIHEITSRKQAEAELKALSHRLQLATRAGKIGVWDWNVYDDLLFWDNRMMEIYEITSDDFVGNIETWANFLHPDDRPKIYNAFSDTIMHETPFEIEFRIVLRTGAIRYIKCNAIFIRGANEAVQRMVGVNLDITELKEAENTLLAALEKEKELGELKSRFVSMASHEFRTPLAGILATTETLTVYRDRMNDQQIDDRLEKIRIQVNHMKVMMDDVLRLARMQSGRMDYQPAENDIDELCRELVEEFDSQQPYRGRIQYTCEALTPFKVIFDRQLMRQIINNLIHNALKYSEQDQPVEVDLSMVDCSLQLIVKDNGIGIPKADIKHLFEPFHRAANVGTISGTGLGLSIARQAIDSHHGEIRVESEVNVGTTFTLLIPLVHNGDNDDG